MEEQFYTKQKIDAERLAAWKLVGYSALMFALAGIYYWIFSDLEESGGSIRLNAIVVAIYEMMGLTGGTWFFIAIGALILPFAVRKLMKGYRMKQDPNQLS
jgi:hypothetical protein